MSNLNNKLKRGVALLALLFIGFQSYATHEFDLITETTKLTKEYDVSADSKLQLDNQFGDIDVYTWSENKIVIEVIISVDATSDEFARKAIDKIDIDFDQNGKIVSAKTLNNLAKTGKSIKEFHIDYKVRMPASNDLDVVNTFGDVSLDKLYGIAKLKVEHGTVNVGKLTNPRCVLDVTFGRLTVNELTTAEVVIRHSDLNLNFANNLMLDSRFSIANVKKVSGGIFIKDSHGTVTVSEMAEGFENVNVKGDFSNVNLNFHASSSYMLDIDQTLSTINYPRNASTIKKSASYDSAIQSAKVGRGNPSGTVIVKSNHSTISFWTK